MNDIPVPQARYAIIPDDTSAFLPCRKKCLHQNRYVLLLLIAAILTFVIATVYVATIGIHEKLLYPKYNEEKEVPQQWIMRAITYNNINNNVINKTQRIINQRHYLISNKQIKLVCYYFVQNDTENALNSESVDPNLCTHINIAFASVVNNSIYLDNYQIVGMQKIVKLKEFNGNLKVLLSVGGAGNDLGFPKMVMDHQNRKTFIKSVLYYVKSYGLDGVDLDWEFPGEHPGTDKKQSVHFAQLLHEIREEINRQDRHKFLLSVAVAAPIFMIDNSYYVEQMNNDVDYINLMSYDYHFYTRLTPFTGINAPLYSSPGDVWYFAQQNINISANYWRRKGMAKEKIVIGLPTYGHSFTLINVKNNGINAPAAGYGKLGNLGFVDYSDICWFLTKNQIKPVFDMDTRSPYATKYSEWISFDDIESLTYKAEYIRNHDFGGAMILSLNTDDHKGVCTNSGDDQSTFPLTRKIKEVLNNDL